MNLLVLDNYDSFTYNLVHLLRTIGVDPDVRLNDAITPDEAARYDALILSPGPGLPSESGNLPAIIRAHATTRPILGICLGHQAIAEHFGATLDNMPRVFHGVQTTVRI